jgi:thiamine biosynthesis protein ThiC
MKITTEIKARLEAAIAEVAELIEDEREFEAMAKAKAKAVCDTIGDLEPAPELEEIRARLMAVADGYLTGAEPLTDELRSVLEFQIVEVAQLIESEQELEAMEKAKAVCDTLRTLRPGPEVDEVRERLVETADYLLAA